MGEPALKTGPQETAAPLTAEEVAKNPDEWKNFFQEKSHDLQRDVEARMNELFKQPTGDKGASYHMWESLQFNNKLHKATREQVKSMMRTVIAMHVQSIKYDVENNMINDETRKKLVALDQFIRNTDAISQAVKLQNSPLSKKEEENVVDIPEGEVIQKYLANVSKLSEEDFDDYTDMVFENQKFVSMMVQVQSKEHKKQNPRDPIDRIWLHKDNPAYDENVDSLVDFITGKKKISERLADKEPLIMSALSGMDESNRKDVVAFILGEKALPERLVDIESTLMDVLSGLGTDERKELADFIVGQEKNSQRREAEKLLWTEILKGMEFKEKTDLIVRMEKRHGVDVTRQFMADALMTGGLTRLTIEHMYAQGHIPETMNRIWPAEQVTEILNNGVALKAMVEHDMREAIKQMEEQRPDNAVAHLFTFEKLIWETIGRCGAITVLVNLSLNVFDAITDPERDKEKVKWYQAAAKGFGKGLKDPYVIGGAVVTAAATNIIVPWWKDALYGMSKKDKLEMEMGRHKEFMRDVSENHYELMDYFVEHYESLYEGAADKKGADKKPSYDLTPQDVTKITDQKEPITDDMATKWGYRNPDMAKAALMRMLNYTVRGRKFSTKIQLTEFLKQENMGKWSVEEQHGHAH